MEAQPEGQEAVFDLSALYGSLRRLAFVLCGSREGAEDLVQDTFARCVSRMDSLQDPAQYLRAALINRWRSQERRRVVAARWLGAQRPAAPVMPADLVEWRDLLLGLPPRQRGAIALRYLDDLDDTAIALALGVRPATVRSLIHRGLRTLKENYGAVALIAAGIWALQRQPSNQTIATGGNPALSALPPAPISGRSDMASAWTGRQWLIWGGLKGRRCFADGAAFDPATDRWSLLPPAPIKGRIDPVSAWTGRLWLIWGGTDASTSFRDGAAYDPSTNRWRLLPAAPAALPSDGNLMPEGAWTGQELVIVTSTGHAAAYQPDADRWTPVAAPPGVAATPAANAVWTGSSAVFLLGSTAGVGAGLTGPGIQPPPTSSGIRPSATPAPGDYWFASYDPRTDRWSELPAGGRQPDHEHDLVWTGRLLLALGTSTTPSGSGAAYDPATGEWSPLPAIPAPLVDPGPIYSFASAPPVWTGTSVLLWAGGRQGLSYTPATGTWSSFPAGGGPPRLRQATAWTGTELLGWGGTDAADVRQGPASGIRYQPPSTLPASPTSIPPKPTPSTTVLKNTRITYWGPIASPYDDPNTGVQLSLPPPGATPAISWQQAARPCNTSTGTDNCGVPTNPEEVYLAVGTDRNSGQMGPDGSIIPSMDGTLVYVVVESWSCTLPGGPSLGSQPTSTTTAPRTYTCTGLTFVDATTGKGLDAMSGPGIRPPTHY